MKFLNICTRQTWQSNGQTKTKWLNCGTLKVMDDGKQFITMNHLPDVTFFVFEPKPKQNTQPEEFGFDA